jgi:hypothetical protein
VPNRILREGILTSPNVARLGWAEEVFYRRLMSVVDDFGRYFGDPGMLRAACYPRQLGKVSDSDVGKWLRSCVDADLVRVYQAADMESYVELIKFGQQVRAKKSKYPDALSLDSNCEQMKSSAHLDVSVSVSVSEDEGVTRGQAAPLPIVDKSSRRKAKTEMPKDFAVSEAVSAWAKREGYGQLDKHLDAFRRKCEAKGYTYANWDAAFMEAIREDWAKLRGRTATGAAPPADGGDGEWHETRSGVEKRAAELGLPHWTETEAFPTYKARVLAAHTKGLQ